MWRVKALSCGLASCQNFLEVNIFISHYGERDATQALIKSLLIIQAAERPHDKRQAQLRWEQGFRYIPESRKREVSYMGLLRVCRSKLLDLKVRMN